MYGGAGGGRYLYGGVVYKRTPAGHMKILHVFTGGADGTAPENLTLDGQGNMYGAGGWRLRRMRGPRYLWSNLQARCWR